MCPPEIERAHELDDQIQSKVSCHDLADNEITDFKDNADESDEAPSDNETSAILALHTVELEQSPMECVKRIPVTVRIMPTYPSFSSISPIYCKTSCPKHDVKLHNYALTITTTTRGTCLWSRYPVLVIIRELEDSTSRPSVAS